MAILYWMVFGLVAGVLAKWLMPGSDPQGCLVTSLLGICGATVGGFMGTTLGFGSVNGFDIRSMLLAVLGTVVVLYVYRELKKK